MYVNYSPDLFIKYSGEFCKINFYYLSYFDDSVRASMRYSTISFAEVFFSDYFKLVCLSYMGFDWSWVTTIQR